MVKCNQLCEWNRYKHGCVKPLHVECPSATVFGSAGVSNENPVTNGDHVRAMCDGDMAKFFAKKVMEQVAWIQLREGVQVIGGTQLAAMKEAYAFAFFRWLRSPAEEGGK